MFERIRPTYRTLLTNEGREARMTNSRDIGYGAVPRVGEKKEFWWMCLMYGDSHYLTVREVTTGTDGLPLVTADLSELRNPGHHQLYAESGLRFFQDWHSSVNEKSEKLSRNLLKKLTQRARVRRLLNESYHLVEHRQQEVDVGDSRLKGKYFKGPVPRIGELLTADVKRSAGFCGFVPADIPVIDVLYPLVSLPLVVV